MKIELEKIKKILIYESRTSLGRLEAITPIK